jgi:hypothetical protein
MVNGKDKVGNAFGDKIVYELQLIDDAEDGIQAGNSAPRHLSRMENGVRYASQVAFTERLSDAPS